MEAEEGKDAWQARMARAEEVAQAFHQAYESNAPRFNYSTRPASAVPWDQVPENNKQLMVATVAELLLDGVIK